MQKTVKATEIYEAVLMEAGLKPEEESNKRKLNNKLTFLMEQVALRDKNEFKEKREVKKKNSEEIEIKSGRDIKIPICDAAIVRNLLIEAISEDGMIYDWFNGNVDTII